MKYLCRLTLCLAAWLLAGSVAWAETAHVDIVFQDLVYANPQTDITPQVIAIMDSETFK